MVRPIIVLAALLLALGACGGARSIELDCDPETVSKAALDPDRSVAGFDYPKDALAILSWSRGLPMLESSGDSEVVFVYVEDRARVGAAFVTRGAEGWLVDALWTCPEA